MVSLIEEHFKLRPTQVSSGPDEGPCLFHYTTYGGCDGIATSRSLWATNIHFLNDYTEFKHAIDLMKCCIEQKIKIYNDSNFKSSLTDLLNKLNAGRECNIFVSSFTESSDILSQWRGYGGIGGVSMGFRFDSLTEISIDHKIYLTKCVYDEDRKVNLVNSIIDETYSIYEEYRSKNPSNMDGMKFGIEVGKYFQTTFFRLAPAFKDASFKEEKEWRFTTPVTSIGDKNVSSRSTPSMIIPYYVIGLDIFKTPPFRKMASDKGAYIGCDKIFVGPCNNKDLVMNGLDFMLNSRGVSVNSLIHSDVPYRSL